jgi:hypothetical protein
LSSGNGRSSRSSPGTLRKPADSVVSPIAPTHSTTASRRCTATVKNAILYATVATALAAGALNTYSGFLVAPVLAAAGAVSRSTPGLSGRCSTRCPSAER